MANQELALHRAPVEALIKLSKKDPRRQEIERLAHSATQAATVAVVESQRHTEAPRDLRQETFDLLANLIDPSAEEREAFERKGAIFLPVEAKSLQQVYDENSTYFGYLNESGTLRSYIPPQAFEVAVFPNKLRIARSNNSSQFKQLRLTEEFSQKEIEPEFPGAKAIMLPATGTAQIDIAYQKRNEGKVLIPDFWARCLDATSGSRVAYVGRPRPDNRLRVVGWDADRGGARVWALSAVVFVRK